MQLVARTQQMQNQQRAFSSMIDSAESLALMEADEVTNLSQQLEKATHVSSQWQQKWRDADKQMLILTKKVKNLEVQLFEKEADAVDQAMRALSASNNMTPYKIPSRRSTVKRAASGDVSPDAQSQSTAAILQLQNLGSVNSTSHPQSQVEVGIAPHTQANLDNSRRHSGMSTSGKNRVEAMLADTADNASAERVSSCVCSNSSSTKQHSSRLLMTISSSWSRTIGREKAS